MLVMYNKPKVGLGKSIQLSDFTKDELHAKRVECIKEFWRNIDPDCNKKVAKHEFYENLDRQVKNSKTGLQFSRAIADDLFDKMDEDSDMRIKFEECATVVLQGECALTDKIMKYKQRLVQLDKNIKMFEDKYNAAQRSEKYFEPDPSDKQKYKIMRGSNVKIKVKRISLEENKTWFGSKPIKNKDAIQICSWDEKEEKSGRLPINIKNLDYEITFATHKSSPPLKLSIWDVYSIGSAEISLNSLATQLPITKNIDIKDDKNKKAGFIECELVWSYSKVSIFQLKLRKDYTKNV